MQRRHPITFCLVVVLIVVAAAACKNKKEIQHAKSSVYDTNFAVVFSAALQATRDLYSNVDDFPQNGMIKTAWHQVSYANNQDDLANNRTISQGQGRGVGGGTQSQAAAGMPTRLAYKRHFIRFDISVRGGRPWRVKVVGHASEWEPGNALPTELRGPARPPWLDGRIEALQVSIYRRIKKYAIFKPDEVEVDPGPELPKTDPKSIAGVSPPVAAALATIKDALALRDHAKLRAAVADDVVWSLGGAPGADTAMAMWQADPESLDAMARVITIGCGGDEQRASCPAGAPAAGGWQLVLEPRAGAWKVTSFLRAE